MTKIPPLGFGHLFISRRILKVRKTPPWGFAHLRLSRSRFETVCAQHERRELVKTRRLRFKFSRGGIGQWGGGRIEIRGPECWRMAGAEAPYRWLSPLIPPQKTVVCRNSQEKV